MKKSHEEGLKVDFLKPIDSVYFQDAANTDCFGNEFESHASECSICADAELCLIIWSEKVKTKKKEFEVKTGPNLDQCDFQGVDMIKIERLAKKYEEEGEPMTFEELQKIIQEQAVTKDVESIIQYIKRELPLTKMYLKEGKCLVR